MLSAVLSFSRSAMRAVGMDDDKDTPVTSQEQRDDEADEDGESGTPAPTPLPEGCGSDGGGDDGGGELLAAAHKATSEGVNFKEPLERLLEATLPLTLMVDIGDEPVQLTMWATSRHLMVGGFPRAEPRVLRGVARRRGAVTPKPERRGRSPGKVRLPCSDPHSHPFSKGRPLAARTCALPCSRSQAHAYSRSRSNSSLALALTKLSLSL